jgi:hypothetical protein
MKNKHPFLLLAVAVVSGSYIIGLLASSQFNNSRPPANNGYADGYAAGANDIAKKLTDSGLLPPIISEIKTVSGTVKSVGGDRLEIAVEPLTQNPLDTQGPSERTAIVSDATKITEMIPMTPAERDATMKAFEKNAKDGKIAPPPVLFSTKQASMNDIKIGTVVTVTADNNIKNAATIDATAIEFVAAPALAE